MSHRTTTSRPYVNLILYQSIINDNNPLHHQDWWSTEFFSVMTFSSPTAHRDVGSCKPKDKISPEFCKFVVCVCGGGGGGGGGGGAGGGGEVWGRQTDTDRNRDRETFRKTQRKYTDRFKRCTDNNITFISDHFKRFTYTYRQQYHNHNRSFQKMHMQMHMHADNNTIFIFDHFKRCTVMTTFTRWLHSQQILSKDEQTGLGWMTSRAGLQDNVQDQPSTNVFVGCQLPTMAHQIKIVSTPNGGLHGNKLSPNLGRQSIWANSHETGRLFAILAENQPGRCHATRPWSHVPLAKPLFFSGFFFCVPP